MGDSGFQQAQCGLPHLPPWAGHHSSQVLFPTEVSHKACNSEIPRTDLFCQRPFQSPENGREGEDRRRGKLPTVFLQDRSFRESLASTLSSPPPTLIKLIMNTARGHLTPEIHVNIKYFRNTSI